MLVLGRGLIGVALLALWIYCIFDVIRTEESGIQNLPKMFWLFIVIFIPSIGSIAWLLLGRPPRTSWDLRGPQTMRPPQTGGPPPLPDPDTRSKDHEAKREEALRRYMAEREEELRKREEEIRRLEEDLRGDEGDQPTG